MKRENIIKVGIAVLVIFVLALFSFVAYRVWFEFDNSMIRSYIADEAKKYTDPAAATTILNDGVKAILDNPGLTKQIKDEAKAEGISNEQAIVAYAAMEAQKHYLPNQ